MFNQSISQTERNASPLTLIFQSISIILTNMVPIYGVLHLGWNSFGLVFLFIMEGIIVLFTDIIKVQFFKKEKYLKNNLLIEFCFIFFFGFFAILVYGPYESLENLVSDRLRLIKELIVVEFSIPLLVIAFFRLVRLIQDLLSSGAFNKSKKQPLNLEGGAWSLFLFFAVIAAPIVARTGPNPLGGLVVLVLLKIAGELLLVWISRSNPVRSPR